MQRVRNYNQLNSVDMRLSADYTMGSWVLGADLTSAKVKNQDLYRFTRSNGSTYEANRAQLALRASYRF